VGGNEGLGIAKNILKGEGREEKRKDHPSKDVKEEERLRCKRDKRGSVKKGGRINIKNNVYGERENKTRLLKKKKKRERDHGPCKPYRESTSDRGKERGGGGRRKEGKGWSRK